jgi:hypothetical protein
VRALPRSEGHVSAAALNADGTEMAVVQGGKLQRFRVNDGTAIDGPQAATFKDVAYSGRTGDLVALGGEHDDLLQVWGKGASPLASTSLPDVGGDLSVSRDGQRAVVWSSNTVVLVDVATGAKVQSIPPLGPRAAHTFSPGGGYLAFGQQNEGDVDFFRVSDGTRRATWHPYPEDGAAVVQGAEGEVELLPDEPRTRAMLRCHADKLELPLDVCEERFVVKGLFSRVLAEGG